MTKSPSELSEKDFIQERYSKNPFPFWLWLFLITTVTALFWGGSEWYYTKLGNLFDSSPFLRVTNRQISLFLWQNPEFMRVNAKSKNGYLTGFQYIDKVSIEEGYADNYAVAPPELLFRYHTWSRLVKDEFSARPIPIDEFQEFLKYAIEWQPGYWPNAPSGYVKMIQNLPKQEQKDLNDLPMSELPFDVRIAFQGWKNFFKDGEAINQMKPTYGDLQKFLSKNPHYARNYWRNIVQDTKPNYLKSFTDQMNLEKVIPNTEMTSFLRVALYNFLLSNKPTTSS